MASRILRTVRDLFERVVRPRRSTFRRLGPPRRGLVLPYVQAGSGHRRAAEAIGGAGEAAGLEVDVRDALADLPGVVRRRYERSHLRTARHLPELWKLLYDRSDRIPARHGIHLVRAAVDRAVLGSLRGELLGRPPRAVVCTHHLPAVALADLRRQGRLRAPLHVVVTDYGAHSFWVARGVDVYHVGSSAAAFDLRRRGVPASRIRCSGIPCDPAFRRAARYRASHRRRLGIEGDRPVVLATAGGDGVTRIEKAVAGFRPDGPKLVVVCGRSEKTRERVESAVEARGLDADVRGYTREMPALLAAADLVVTKPGGLTVTEALVTETPLLLTPGIPGQERRNADLLLERGAGRVLAHLEDAAWRVDEILREPGRLDAMRRAARGLARPDAAERIVEAAVGEEAAERRADGPPTRRAA